MLVAIACFVFLAVSVIAWGAVMAWASRGQVAWPRTNAIVRSLSVKDTISDGERYFYVSGSFEYMVEGRSYTSEKIANGYSASPDRDFHLELYKRIRSRTPLVVRYPPGSPEKAIITYSNIHIGHFAIVMGIMFLLICATLVCLVWLNHASKIQLLDNVIPKLESN